MQTTETISTLNDLVAILNDRMEGYTRAKHELDGKEPDLNDLFLELIDESRQLRLELGTEIEASKGEMTTDTMESGKLYRLWMDFKAVFTGHDRHAVLSSCEYGEDAAQKAYKAALEGDDLTAYIREIVEKQKQTLKASHDRIKALRDASE